MSKDQWIADHEYILESLCDGSMDEETARSELTQLGFDPHEIDEQISELELEDE